MLVMAILLALCVGAVSAADTVDMANGGMSDIAVSPVSEDVSVLADNNEDPAGGLNNSEENQTINPIIEVPSSVDVDMENKTGNFNIKVLDVNKSIEFTDKDLKINYNGSNNVTLQFLDNETLFKDGTKVIVDREGSHYIYVAINETDGIYYPVSEYTTIREVTKEITKEVLDENNQTVNITVNETVNETIYYPVAYTLKEGVISFRVPGNDTVAILNIIYSNKTLTSIESSADINLNFSNYNKLNVSSSTNVNIDTKNVTFDVKVLDKNGTDIKDIKAEDFKLIWTYIDSKDNSTKSVNITSFTFNDGKISFKLSQNVTSSNLTIIYKEGTIDETQGVTALNPIINAEIKVLDKESATEYQHNYIVVQLINSVTNKPVVGKTLYYQLLNSSMSVRWGYTTDKNGKCNVSLDYIYSLGSGYIPVAKRYSLIVTAGDNVVATGKNCTINITKCKSTLVANNYTSTYASGKKFILKLTKNGDKKVAVNAKISLRVYFSSKSYQDLTLYTNGSGQGSVGINLGKGKYKVVISVSDTNFSASKITRYITVAAIKNAKISAKATTAYYNCGSKFKVKMTNSKGVALKGAAVLLNVYTGKKYKVVRINTDDKGYAYWTVSGISIGKHRVLIGSGSNGATSNVVQTYITLKKGKTIVTAPKVTNKYKKSAYFNITVKTYGTKKVLKGVYLTVKVYTGKKYKTYKVKTNTKGVASLNTNALSKGTHKVVIGTTNKYYTISKSGNLIIIK